MLKTLRKIIGCSHKNMIVDRIIRVECGDVIAYYHCPECGENTLLTPHRVQLVDEYRKRKYQLL